ncbi:hypothetical protein V4C53_45950 [Paraburkholderia azotifigens]|uniref:hypothetical protein n=1 Tax=Paraburkholderia azotifigens TaxID=2057004 RepID=UPI00317787F7
MHERDKEAIVQVLRQLADLIESGQATVTYMTEQVTAMNSAAGTGTIQTPFFVPGHTWGHELEVTRPGVSKGILDRMVPNPNVQ